MSFRRLCNVMTFGIALIMITTPIQASDSWQQWENLRWSGLQEFSKGNYGTARTSFEQALKEIKQVQPGSEKEVISIHDLAQVLNAEGRVQQSEDYCRQALELSKTACPSDSALITLILHSLVSLKRHEHKYEEVAKLRSELDERADASVNARTIGVASMEQDGTIKLDLRAESGSMVGHGSLSYPPAAPEYKETLMHLGPLKPGGQKLVAPWK
jgi:tetratricopeptide (TPR) repeat protein